MTRANKKPKTRVGIRKLNLQDKRFSRKQLISNSAISAAGATLTAVSITGAIFPALAVGAVGAVVSYTVMNEIPKA